MRKFAKKLRRNQTEQEVKLWRLLRNRRLAGHKFRRQVLLGDYIVDFCCFQKKLIIELDGGHHDDSINREKDLKRDKYFADQGYKILRIWNSELDNNLDGVFGRRLK